MTHVRSTCVVRHVTVLLYCVCAERNYSPSPVVAAHDADKAVRISKFEHSGKSVFKSIVERQDVRSTCTITIIISIINSIISYFVPAEVRSKTYYYDRGCMSLSVCLHISKMTTNFTKFYGRPMEYGRPLYFHLVVSFFLLFFLA